MSLEFFVTDLPEGQESLYKEVEGGFQLDVVGVVPVTKFQEVETRAKDLDSKLGEFRTNNIQLKQQLEKATGVTGTDLTSLVEEQVQAHVSEMKKNLDTLQEQIKQKDAQLEQVILSDGVKDAAIKYGVLDSAIPDVLNRAKETFIVKDGKAVSKTKGVDKEGNSLNINSWIQQLSEGAPHLFAKSSGAGAQRSKGGQGMATNLSGTDKIAAGLNKL